MARCFSHWVPGVNEKYFHPSVIIDKAGLSRVLNVTYASHCQSHCQEKEDCAYFAWDVTHGSCIHMQNMYVQNRLEFITADAFLIKVKRKGECDVDVSEACMNKKVSCLECDKKSRCVTKSKFIGGPKKCTRMLFVLICSYFLSVLHSDCY